jgi:hypothetical protein
MAEYGDGAAGQVENEQYCMKKSWNARNVDDMNSKMGYHDMSDLANTSRPPTRATGEKTNAQMGPKAANAKMNDRHGKAE